MTPINIIGAEYFNDLFMAVPVFDNQNRNGATDYIDYLKWDELAYPIMSGVSVGRPFLVFKFTHHDRQHLMVLFQRYTDDDMFWILQNYDIGVTQMDAVRFKSLQDKLNGINPDYVLVASPVTAGFSTIPTMVGGTDPAY